MYNFIEPKCKPMSLEGGIENYRPPTHRLKDKPAPAGRKVIFHPENGTDYDREEAEDLFPVGTILTVKEIEVGRSSSLVEFDEHPYMKFNTVMFGDV